MIEDAKRYQQDDQEKMKLFSTRNNFETFCRDFQSRLELMNGNKDLIEKCEQEIQWLNDSPFATEEEMKKREEDVRAMAASNQEAIKCYSPFQQDSTFATSESIAIVDKPIGQPQSYSYHGSSQVPSVQGNMHMPSVHHPFDPITFQRTPETFTGVETRINSDGKQKPHSIFKNPFSKR